MRGLKILLFLVLVVTMVATAEAAFLIPDDFEDGTVQGWVHGGGSGNPPVNVPTGGPDGVDDNFLQAFTNNAPAGPGSALLAFNASTWQGDYTGLSGLNFDVRNLSVEEEDLNIRIAIGGAGGAFTSTDSVFLPQGSDWQNVTFSLEPADFTSTNGGIFGQGTDIDATLADVLQLRIISAAAIQFQGDSIPGIMGLDNIVILPSCDFDGNAACNVDDLNLMLAEGPIAGGVAVTPGVNDQFDLTGDDVINLDDVDQWLADAGQFNGFASPYKSGDANLDGVVDGMDFILWNGSKFTATLDWNDGNFNGDSVTDGQDFLLWNGNKFTSSDVSVVPEPTAGMLACLVGLTLVMIRRARR